MGDNGNFEIALVYDDNLFKEGVIWEEDIDNVNQMIGYDIIQSVGSFD